MSTNPFDMDDLLGAYALDAVSDDERRAVEEYLANNPRAQAEVQQHREVATMLAWSGMDAPDGLWDRIAGTLDGRDDVPETSLGNVLSFAKPNRRRMVRTIGSWAVATAAAALIAVIVAVRWTRSDDGTPSLAKVESAAFSDPSLPHAQLTSTADPAVKVLAVVDRNGHGYLQAQSLPALSDQRTYQLWGQVGDHLVSLGLLGSHPQTAVFAVGNDVTLLAITAEAQGGVTTSKNQPVVAGPVT